VDKVANHHAIVGDFLLLQAFLADGLLADLSAEDLCSDVVLSRKYKLHLVEDKVNLFLVLE